MRRFVLSFVGVAVLFLAASAFSAGKAEHVVVVVWDGMRPDFISKKHTPTLYQLVGDGVMFQNHHSVYCTATEVNGTAIATGQYPSHSGLVANNEYRPEINLLKSFATQSREAVSKGDQLTGGHYLLRPTLAEILQAAGRETVIVGSKDVALLHDRRERTNDSSAHVNLFQGKTLPPSAYSAITNLLGAFPKEANTKSLTPNEARDQWTTRALLGPLWSNGVPVFSLLWLSEPDFSQHASGPGSEKALAALESSDRQLAAVLSELEHRNLRDKTDLFVVSDHGFSTVERAVDVCVALQKAGFRAKREFKSPPQQGDVLVIGQGGSVLFYVIGGDAEVAGKLVEFLQQQEFSGIIFTREKMEGTFTLDAANINSPNPPDVVLSMRWSSKNSETGAPGLFWSDGSRQPGGGNHASLSRFDVHNTLVAAGPDLKKGFKNEMPTGNTDLAPTILWLLGVKPDEPMDGRVLSEALTVESPPTTKPVTRRLEATASHGPVVWRQYLQVSQVNETIYLDEGNGSAARE